MLKSPPRLKHCIPPFFGVDDVILLSQNRYFSENGSYDFLILCIRVENINIYQIAKTASKLIHCFRSYRLKTWLMMSSLLGPQFSRDKNSTGQGLCTVIVWQCLPPSNFLRRKFCPRKICQIRYLNN